MLVNKSKKARIESYSRIFFQLGLVLALLVVYVSIEWKSFDRYVNELNIVDLQDEETEDIPITERIIEMKPPPPPPPAPEKIQIVADQEEIEETVLETTETDESEAVETIEIEDIEEVAIRFKPALKKSGILWISWPKGSSMIKTNLKRDFIREYLLDNGLVDVKVAAIDEDWSGLKFVYRLKDR